ncbi:diacylglycerol binding protein Bzz1 [Schizosaccharomyces japonicus yFS275]|uniref:Protein BZZ1 n=1 Tax=Schizosaccharomyces japonicus (strain yFS275 / FY16936) TaxID=402676 RepID=B6K6X9_SCHJY|nr:diacylglycerol binding protein Bzz1 [Schizosaccharomyces japonicus yFS275]EEB09283.2 diacylglycerol binding protein Bzz1 [Schizosaccharomyces japonicus yFS275]
MSVESVSISAYIKDDYKTVDSWVQNGVKWLEELHQFYKERSLIEKEYSQKLASLAKKYFEKKNKRSSSLSIGDSPTSSAGSLECASLTTWTKILDGLTEEARRIQNFSNDLGSQISDQFLNLQGQAESMRRNQHGYYNSLLDERERIDAGVKKAKQDYYSSCEVLESARQKKDKLGDDKSKRGYQDALTEMNNKKNGYVLTITEFNAHTKLYFSKLLPDVVDSLQQVNEFRVQKMNSLWKHSLHLEKSCYSDLSQKTDELNNEINLNSPNLDTVMFVKHNQKNWTPPNDLPFEPSPIWHDTDSIATYDTNINYLRNMLIQNRKDFETAAASYESVMEESNKLEKAHSKSLLELPHAVVLKMAEVEQLKARFQTRMHDLQSRIDLILNTAGALDEGTQPHDFRHTSFALPTNCDYCKSTIWGLSKHGCVCKRCNYHCHARCEMKVPPECGKAEPLVSISRNASLRRSNVGSISSTNYANTTRSVENHGAGSMRNEEVDDFGNIAVSRATTNTSESQPSPFGDSSQTPADAAATSAAENETVQVLYDYVGTTDDDLNVKEGQMVVILQPDDGTGWVRARSGSAEGLVPASYLDLPGQASVAQDESYVRALYDYTAQTDLEISLQAGDVIRVIQRDSGNGWSEGELDGRIGQFPANYVEDI